MYTYHNTSITGTMYQVYVNVDVGNIMVDKWAALYSVRGGKAWWYVEGRRCDGGIVQTWWGRS